MFALVESGTITQFPKGNKGITIGDNQYPKTIYSLWTEAERNAIGIYTVEIDSTNRKNEEFYINTDITYAFGSGKVTGSYGTATAKAIADSLYTSQDNTDGLIPEGKSVGDVKVQGLKSMYKNKFNAEAAGMLSRTDWYVIKAADVTDYNVPSNIATYRAAVRTKVNAMETSIDNCLDVDALITLLTYTEQEDGSITRPLGEFPDEVV
jgi:hypothetical protein